MLLIAPSEYNLVWSVAISIGIAVSTSAVDFLFLCLCSLRLDWNFPSCPSPRSLIADMQEAFILLIVVRFVLFLIVLRAIVVYGYRIFLHPLHHLNGPFVASFTDWYGACFAIRKSLTLRTYLNHRKYGSIYRHGPNKVVFNSARALHEIYQNERLLKSRAYLVTQPFPDVFNLFNVLDKRLHRVRRRLVGEGINDRAMREFEPLMLAHIDTFVRELAKSCENETIVNMTNRCRYLGFDIIGELGFGTALDMQTSPRNRFMLAGMDASNFRSNLYIQFPLLKRAGMELLLYPFILTSQMAYYKKLRDLISARRAEGKNARKDLCSFVVDAKDPETGEGMRLRDIWSEAAFFMPAGGDTTSTALTGVFFYLSRYPEVYQRLAHEIRTTFTTGLEIRSGTKLMSCTYLRACIDEAMRITPPIATTLWRQLPESDNKQPMVIEGQVIPPGTEVGVNIYSIHHNEEYFPDSHSFEPERWLDETPQRKKLMHGAFTPFSIGSRGCGGKSMAYQELYITIAKTFWYLDFERPKQNEKADRVGETRRNGGKPELDTMDQFGSIHAGPNLVFKLRPGLSGERIESRSFL